jgi:hypothetical protein
MPEGFHKISEVFNKEPSLANIRKLIKQSDIVNDFEKIFPDLAKIAEAVRIENKCIFLRVQNSTWRSELKFREQQLIKKINNYYKEERINQVRFVP